METTETLGQIVKFSPRAIKEIQKLIAKEEDSSKSHLRLGAKKGGCAGFSYIFELDAKKEEQDIVEKIQDFELVVDKTQAALVLGLVVDYESGLNNRGFTFTNPNANTTCGCGTSFG
jgi:iron-sulfur cluster assembly protein